MTNKTPDIVVIGLGPAGSCAAESAACAGLRVIGLEKRTQAGTPVQCAEFVPSMIERDVPTVGTVTEQLIARMLTFVEGDEIPDETSEFRGRMVDRAKFDRLLATRAAKAGADCRYGVTVHRIAIDGTVHCSDGARFEPRVLIGADGPRSRVGSAIGQSNRELVETRQVTAPLVLPHDATDIFLSADYRGGYGWLFPKGAVANVGVGVSVDDGREDGESTRRGLKSMLLALLARLANERRIGTSCWALTGGAIPVGGRLKSIGQLDETAVLLAGDAAGLTNPVTGAGIASAVQSGTMAGHAAADFVNGRTAALDDYEQELSDIFDPALNRALRRRRELLACHAEGRPDARTLRDGWIGSPRYWRPERPTDVRDARETKVEEWIP